MSIILVVLAFGIIMSIAIIYLPTFKGLTSVKVSKSKKKSAATVKKAQPTDGYVPPDAYSSSTPKVSKFQSIKNLNVSAKDIPIQIHLEERGSDLRKRKEKLSLNNNPDTYDYDIDELIREEGEEEARAFYKKEVIGKTSEEVV